MTTDADLFALLRAEVLAALRELLPDLPEEATTRVLVEPPREAAHGDMATNAALVVAKLAKLPPPKLAADLAAKLATRPMKVALDAAATVAIPATPPRVTPEAPAVSTMGWVAAATFTIVSSKVVPTEGVSPRAAMI